jgi:hypothetical protein
MSLGRFLLNANFFISIHLLFGVYHNVFVVLITFEVLDQRVQASTVGCHKFRLVTIVDERSGIYLRTKAGRIFASEDASDNEYLNQSERWNRYCLPNQTVLNAL